MIIRKRIMTKINNNKFNSLIENNLEAYEILYIIENMLRITIVNGLNFVDPFWYKNRLPGDIYAKYKDGRKITRANKWSKQIFHHPIYYVDFPDLKKIISSSNNWDDVFKQYFNKKEVLIGYLESLEFTRNNIAHNRLVNDDEINHLKDIFVQIRNALNIDESKLENFLDPKLNINPLTFLEQLLEEAKLSFEHITKIKKIDHTIIYDQIKNKWWFDSDYLGFNTEIIKEFFELIKIYENLNWSRGSGYKIEDWVKKIIMNYFIN